MIWFCILDGSVAIYKIGKKGEFLPKLYFFGSSGLDLFFRCSVGFILSVEMYLGSGGFGDGFGVFLGDFFISGVNSRLFFLWTGEGWRCIWSWGYDKIIGFF